MTGLRAQNWLLRVKSLRSELIAIAYTLRNIPISSHPSPKDSSCRSHPTKFRSNASNKRDSEKTLNSSASIIRFWPCCSIASRNDFREINFPSRGAHHIIHQHLARTSPTRTGNTPICHHPKTPHAGAYPSMKYLQDSRSPLLHCMRTYHSSRQRSNIQRGKVSQHPKLTLHPNSNTKTSTNLKPKSKCATVSCYNTEKVRTRLGSEHGQGLPCGQTLLDFHGIRGFSTLLIASNCLDIHTHILR